MIPVLALLFFVPDVRTDALIAQIAASGQIVEIATSAHERVSPRALIAPGAPPLLSFRMIEGRLRHRFGDLDLVADDAGH